MAPKMVPKCPPGAPQIVNNGARHEPKTEKDENAIRAYLSAHLMLPLPSSFSRVLRFRGSFWDLLGTPGAFWGAPGAAKT